MRIGIIGGGQLARMMALAGYPLGLRFAFVDPKDDACAGDLAHQLQGEYDDQGLLAELARHSDVVTFDFENVPESSLRHLQHQVPVHPRPAALAASQDRLSEKELFTQLGIPTPSYRPVDSRSDLDQGVAALGYPAVLKTRRLGYDGKGQRLLQAPDDLDEAWSALGDRALILEERVDFKRELSVLAVRGSAGELRFYPLVENQHKQGILVNSFAPAAAGQWEEAARDYARRLVEHFDYVGVLALELFDRGDRLLANEMAPRVHNSGHWTIDGAEISQFENHLRAILGWPLGSTQAIGCSAMMNWIGAVPKPDKAIGCDNVHWHDYGKRPRAGRKVGHTTVRAADMQTLQINLQRLAIALGDQLSDEGAEGFASE